MRPSLLALLFALVPTVGCSSDETPDDPAAGASGSGGSGAGVGGVSAGGSSGAGTGGSTGGQAGANTGGTGGAGASGGSGAGQSGGGGQGGSAGTSGAGGALGGTAGTGGSAASGGAGAGAGGTAGTTGDPCAAAIFCDDFESYTVGSPPGGMWAARTDAGAVTVDSTEKVSGEKSVKVSTEAGGGGGALIRLMDASVFPVPGNAYYGRMMFRLESAPTAAVHWTIIQGGGVVPGATHHALYRYGGQHPVDDMGSFVGSQLMANYETPDWYSNMSTQGSDCWRHADSVVLPTGPFTCIEWQFDGPNNGMRLWLDGTAVESLTVTGSGDGCVNAANDFAWSAPEFENLDLGWEFYQQDEARTAWIDDVVISTTRVGCP